MPFHIPKFWASATGSVRGPRDTDVPLKCFGHSDSSVSDARGNAKQILDRLGERVRAGLPWPERYGYADRPIREEILRELRAPSGALDGYLTRTTPMACRHPSSPSPRRTLRGCSAYTAPSPAGA